MAWQNHPSKEECSQVLKYSHLPWGELIYGTKHQLLSLGLGVSVSFPTTSRKSVGCYDPRGYPTKIDLSEYMGAGIYSASISLPGRDRPDLHAWTPYALNVEFRKYRYLDEYKGTPLSLIAAGLVDPDCLPGKSGMGKIQVTLNAEGKKCRFNGLKLKDAVGRITIKKISRTLIVVSVVVPEKIAKFRYAEFKRMEDEWESRMALLPRPKPLVTLPVEELTSIRLVFAKEDGKFQKILETITNLDSDDPLKNDLL